MGTHPADRILDPRSRAQAADGMLACLEAIDVERPKVDHARIEWAVKEHLRELDLERELRWCSNVDQMTLGEGCSHAWIARAGRRSSRQQWWLRHTDLSDTPEFHHLVNWGLHRLKKLDAEIYRNSNSLRWARSSTSVTNLVHDTLVLLLFSSGFRAARWKVRSRWWTGGVPARALRSIERLADAAAAGLFAIRVFPGLCMITARPRVTLREGRPHRWDGGPAVEWEDGSGLYYWRGVNVPPDMGSAPDTLRISRIRSIRNAEVRRVAIERMGHERYVKESKATLVRSDRFGKLWHASTCGERLAYVEVVDATPTPDGTHKTYFLRVPRHLRTPRAAVAWTFGYDRVRDYRPAVET